MNKLFAIFDMDGTLVDSMVYWQRLGREYLTAQGVTEGMDEVLERIKAMTMAESSALFIETFGLPGTPESVAAEMNAVMDEHYRSDIPLKPGAADYLAALKKRGTKMCVATATPEPLALDVALTHMDAVGAALQGDLHAVVHHKRHIRKIHQQHLHLSSIVGVYRARRVEHGHTMLEGQTASRTNLRLMTCGKGDVKTCGYELALHGLQCDGLFKICPQVHSCTHFRGVPGVFDALLQFGGEFSLPVDGFDDVFLAVLQFRKPLQLVGDGGDFHLVEVSRRLLAVAADEGYGGTVLEECHRVFHLRLAELQTLGDKGVYGHRGNAMENAEERK